MPIRFVHITDNHYWPNAPKDYGPPKMLSRGREVLDAMVPAINALKPDFIIHGGDILCGGGDFDLSTAHYMSSLNDAAEAFSRFQAPIYYVPGNHDCTAREGSFAAFAVRFPIPTGNMEVVSGWPFQKHLFDLCVINGLNNR